MVILPSTPQTHDIIGYAEFAVMRKGVFFINGGRGQTVNTDALEALNNGIVRAAGLNVVNPEPLPASNPLWQMSSAIMTPHIAGGISDYDEKVAVVFFLDNLRRYIKEKPLQFVVDKNEGY